MAWSFCPYDRTVIVPSYQFCPTCGRRVAEMGALSGDQGGGLVVPGAPDDPYRSSPPVVPSPPQVEMTDQPFELEVRLEHQTYPVEQDSLVRAVVGLRAKESLVVPELRCESHMVLVLDVSGSMDRPDKYPMLKQALELMLRGLEDGLYVTIVLFSTEAVLLREYLTAERARAEVNQILYEMDCWWGRFQTTLLAGGLDLALDAVERFRVYRREVVNRIYILTDGQIHDEPACMMRAQTLERLGVEANSYGFGEDFAFESLQGLLRRSTGGWIKHIRTPGVLIETFQHVAQVTSSIVASEAALELRYGEGVIPGDLFSHRPASRYLPWEDFADPMAPRVEVGNLEAGRTYEWAIEARLPDDVADAFPLGELRLDFTAAGIRGSQRWPLTVPILGDDLGPADKVVRQIFTSLEDLRDSSPEAQIASLAARIEIARREGRDPAHIEAMEAVKASLERGDRREDIDGALWRSAHADYSTCVGGGNPLAWEELRRLMGGAHGAR